eukprot:Nk52_evm1s1893 gene=Nk52_evmTU1s1893
MRDKRKSATQREAKRRQAELEKGCPIDTCVRHSLFGCAECFCDDAVLEGHQIKECQRCQDAHFKMVGKQKKKDSEEKRKAVAMQRHGDVINEGPIPVRQARKENKHVQKIIDVMSFEEVEERVEIMGVSQ